ncbi:hypothetical protein [[Phormidium] sp. ETS-05]|uniref:hypothetical protein n=1 Tax=[Phormidium] sp. ETS-05 TaxID=222819 RepID=UPI0018EED943|nr:hypothetical protein [[Phormidium] sp. ETS-05]
MLFANQQPSSGSETKKLPEMGRAASGKYSSNSLAWMACSEQDNTLDGCLGLVLPGQ